MINLTWTLLLSYFCDDDTDCFHIDDHLIWTLKSKTTKIRDLRCRPLISLLTERTKTTSYAVYSALGYHNSSAVCIVSY